MNGGAYTLPSLFPVADDGLDVWWLLLAEKIYCASVCSWPLVPGLLDARF